MNMCVCSCTHASSSSLSFIYPAQLRYVFGQLQCSLGADVCGTTDTEKPAGTDLKCFLLRIQQSSVCV